MRLCLPGGGMGCSMSVKVVGGIDGHRSSADAMKIDPRTLGSAVLHKW